MMGTKSIMTVIPLNNDTDGDGLNDGDEVNIYFSNLTLEDSDGDGLDDGNNCIYGPEDDEVLRIMTPMMDGLDDGKR